MYDEKLEIAKQIVQTIPVCSTVTEGLLYKEQDLLRFANNLAVISKLLLYVRAYGMPYKRDETPTSSDKIRHQSLVSSCRSCADVS